MSNRLINETSPYLLQHAHNPVDWYPWGDEALQKAVAENKPILISIGYSACHWCHVMERESFEDNAVAAIMNKHFVNIKIDREERPDLDHIYMDAVQVMTGSGGWPLNVFLTPDARPFYGGTYFPPVKAFNRASWTDVLEGVASAFAERRSEIAAQANDLTAHLLKSNVFGEPVADDKSAFTHANTQLIFENLMKSADTVAGGFGRAPKFPQTFSIQYLLRYYHFYKNEQALKQACLSLDKMLYGGIYDQVGGGFARYSTDAGWLVPHFEKMLYDNALLVITLAEAYQITHHKRYADTIAETIGFIEREMMTAANGFYAALDADSEGEEGKFYVWSKQEIDNTLGNDAALFAAYYDVTSQGNWEGKIILNVPIPPEIFVKEHGIELEAFMLKMAACRQKLLAKRSSRPRPLLDDKVLLGWNALMNVACAKAYAATGVENYRKLAISNMEFIASSFSVNGSYFHSFKNGAVKHRAFLDDIAFLIWAMTSLQEITGDPAYLQQASQLTGQVLEQFADTESPFFFYTNSAQTDVIIRKKEIYDSAVPSGNSVMAGNLLYLSRVFDNKDWNSRAIEMIGTLLGLTTRYPGSFGMWANQAIILTNGLKEIVITGQKFNEILFEILHIFNPAGILQSSSVPNENFPLLKGKQFLDPFLIYVCQNHACQPPVNSLALFVQQIDSQHITK